MQTSYYLGEYIIQQSQSATYLGVKIDQRLKWSEYISSTISKANAANAFLNVTLVDALVKLRKLLLINGKTNIRICFNSLVTSYSM